MSSASSAIAEHLRIEPDRVADAVAAGLRRQIGVLRRSGFVVAMSGGVDSAVCAALAVRAVGPGRVLGLALPESESDPESLRLAQAWATQLGIGFVVEDITPILLGCRCYARRDAAIRRLVPEYDDDWRAKLLVDAGGPESGRLSLAYLALQSPAGETRRLRLPAREFREIVAATNFKQRVRAMIAYYHADRLHYAVVGTPNRLEFDQGFFVKGGDGLADVKPIAHLYKTQVFQLAEYLGVPDAIRDRTPTTDTYSLPQTQEEFFFTLPLEHLDVVLHARNEGRDPEAVAAELGRHPAEIKRAYREIERKRDAARYLHLPPLLVEPVPEAERAADAR